MAESVKAASSTVPTEIESQLLKYAARIFYLMVATVFGAGVFFGVVNWRLDDMQADLGEVKVKVLDNYDQRLRGVEMILARGLLPESAKRLDRLESAVFPRKK